MQTSQQRLVTKIARFFPEALFYKKTSQKVVALTIDDMPTPGEADDASSQLILDTISTYNQSLENERDRAHATFFIISSHLSDQSNLLERMIEQGHEVANHGTEDETTALLKPEIFAAQFQEAHKRITEKCNQPLRWYRPGRGLYNKSMLKALPQILSYVPRLALASMLPVDTFQPTHDAKFTAWYASKHFFPGAILVLHGGSLERCEQTAKALPLILTELHQQGYRVVTLSELWDMP